MCSQHPSARRGTDLPPGAHPKHTDVEQGEGVPSEEEEWPYDKLHRHGVLAGNCTKLIEEGKQITQ